MKIPKLAFTKRKYYLFNLLIPVIAYILAELAAMSSILPLSIIWIFIWVALPWGMIAMNHLFMKQVSFRELSSGILFCVIGALWGQAISYVIWGIDTGLLFSPDDETMWVSQALLIYTMAVLMSGGLLLLLLRHLSNRPQLQ